MTGLRISILFCNGDNESCAEEFTLMSTITLAELRTHAHKAGWTTKGRRDFCPKHSKKTGAERGGAS